MEPYATEIGAVLRLNMPNTGRGVLLQHGFNKMPGTGATCYAIDFDFYAENKVETHDVTTVLNELHRGVGAAFRWCILDELHAALEPHPIADAEDG